MTDLLIFFEIIIEVVWKSFMLYLTGFKTQKITLWILALVMKVGFCKNHVELCFGYVVVAR